MRAHVRVCVRQCARAFVCMQCVRDERERERVCVSVCVCERERVSVCVCVCVRGVAGRLGYSGGVVLDFLDFPVSRHSLEPA